MARKKAPPRKLTSAITALDGMAGFIGIWTGEALKRLKAGDERGAADALKGLDSHLAEMLRLYKEDVSP